MGNLLQLDCAPVTCMYARSVIIFPSLSLFLSLSPIVYACVCAVSKAKRIEAREYNHKVQEGTENLCVCAKNRAAAVSGNARLECSVVKKLESCAA